MKPNLNPRRLLVAGGVFGALFAGVKYVPMAWVLVGAMPAPYADAVSAKGTLWHGYIVDTEGKFPVLETQLKATQILGAAPMNITTLGSNISVTGDIGPRGVSSMNMTYPLSQAGLYDTRFTGLSGYVRVRDASVTLTKTGEQCEQAQGLIETDIVRALSAQADGGNILGATPLLTGALECVDGNFSATLTGSAPLGSATAKFNINFDGRYFANVTLSTTQPQAATLLPLYGFEAKNGRYELLEQGRWR